MSKDFKYGNPNLSPREKAMSLFYPKTRKPVNFSFLIIGLVAILFSILTIYTGITGLNYGPINYIFWYQYLSIRILTVGLIEFIGCCLFLKLKTVGWALLSSIYFLSLIDFLIDTSNQLAIEDMNVVVLVLTKKVVEMIFLVYLFFGRPAKIFQLNTRLRLIPLVGAILFFITEKVVLFLTL